MVSVGCTPRDRNVGTGTGGNVAQPVESGPIQITVEDPLDIPFLHNDPRITIGNVYEITTDVWFGDVINTNVHVQFETRPAGQGMAIRLTGRIPDFNRNDPIRIVFLYTPTQFAQAPSFMNSELVSIERR